VPRTYPPAGPPCPAVHIVPRGTGANGDFSAASVRHARARLGSVPPSGLQRTILVVDPLPLPSGQTVTRRSVDDCATAVPERPSPAAATTAAMRPDMFPGYVETEVLDRLEPHAGREKGESRRRAVGCALRRPHPDRRRRPCGPRAARGA